MSESSGAILFEEEKTLRSRILDRVNALVPKHCNLVEMEEEKGQDSDLDIQIVGPIPDSSQLFAGFVFILTKANSKLEVDPENVSDDVYPYLETTVYNKGHLHKQLISGKNIFCYFN